MLQRLILVVAVLLALFTVSTPAIPDACANHAVCLFFAALN
jgi:hypothetical protein